MSRLLGVLATLVAAAFIAFAPASAFARGGGHGGGGGHFGGFQGGGFHGGGFHGYYGGYHGYYRVGPRLGFAGYGGYYPSYYGYGSYYAPACVVYTPYGPVMSPVCYGY